MKIYLITDIGAPNQDQALSKKGANRRNVSYPYLIKKPKEQVKKYFFTGKSK